MRFNVATVEWQRVLKIVKAVSTASSNVRCSAHSACLFRVTENDVRLEFALNGAFLAYRFESLQVLGGVQSGGEFKKALDLETLQSLRFSGRDIDIEIMEQGRSSTISFSSGNLKGKVYASIPDIEADLEASRPDIDAVPFSHQFSIKDFRTALSAHLYGQHHDNGALKRPVRVYSQNGSLFFESRDQIAGGAVVKNFSEASPIDFFLNPSHLLAVLDALDESRSNTFAFGYNDGMWCVGHDRLCIWMPNLLKPMRFDLQDLFRAIDTAPSYKVTVPPIKLKAAISELTPFVNSAQLATKEDLPVVCLVVNKEKEVYLRVETTRAKQVTQHLGAAQFESDLPLDRDEEVYVNIKFLDEFNSHLNNNRQNDAEPLWIKWWTHQDPSMPTKGKGVCLGLGSNRFLTSRTNFKRMSRDI